MASGTHCVRQRRFGSDVDFSRWIRSNKALPSFSKDVGFVATDIDYFIHNYLISIDGQGSREVQTLMTVEVKTRNGRPNKSQADTLAKQHFTSFSKQVQMFGSQAIRNFGVSVLCLSGTAPDNSERMMWGRFHRSELRWKEIDLQTLDGLLLTKLHPDSLDANPLRRHHKTRAVVVNVRTPLGFDVQKEIVHRS